MNGPSIIGSPNLIIVNLRVNVMTRIKVSWDGNSLKFLIVFVG